MKEPISITGLHLNVFARNIQVSVEVNGKWFEVLSENYDGEGHISHIVEPAGIASIIAKRKEDVNS